MCRKLDKAGLGSLGPRVWSDVCVCVSFMLCVCVCRCVFLSCVCVGVCVSLCRCVCMHVLSFSLSFICLFYFAQAWVFSAEGVPADPRGKPQPIFQELPVGPTLNASGIQSPPRSGLTALLPARHLPDLHQPGPERSSEFCLRDAAPRTGSRRREGDGDALTPCDAPETRTGPSTTQRSFFPAAGLDRSLEATLAWGMRGNLHSSPTGRQL